MTFDDAMALIEHDDDHIDYTNWPPMPPIFCRSAHDHIRAMAVDLGEFIVSPWGSIYDHNTVLIRKGIAGGIGAPRLGRVRGPIGDDVTFVSTTLDPMLTIKALSKLTSIPKRTLLAYINLDPGNALPCYRLPGVSGRIVVKVSEWEAWIKRYRCKGRPSLVHALKELGLDPEVDHHPDEAEKNVTDL